MAAQKSTLTPELKEIYDRVMNTTTAAKAPLQSAPLATTVPAQPQASTIAQPPVEEPNAAQEALSSTPARPLSSQTSFTFSGKADPIPDNTADASLKDIKKDKKHATISLPVLIGLGVIFILVWGFFCWVIIFRLMK